MSKIIPIKKMISRMLPVISGFFLACSLTNCSSGDKGSSEVQAPSYPSNCYSYGTNGQCCQSATDPACSQNPTNGGITGINSGATSANQGALAGLQNAGQLASNSLPSAGGLIPLSNQSAATSADPNNLAGFGGTGGGSESAGSGSPGGSNFPELPSSNSFPTDLGYSGGSAGSGGGSGSTGSGLSPSVDTGMGSIGGSGPDSASNPNDPKGISANSSYSGGGSAGPGGGMSRLSADAGAGLSGVGGSLNFDRRLADQNSLSATSGMDSLSNVNPLGSADPKNYFLILKLSDNLFKVVERRYMAKAGDWAITDARQLLPKKAAN